MADETTETGDAKPIEGAASIDRLKRQLTDFYSAKSEEQKERQESRRYYHGAHWTAADIKTLDARKQPVITYNRISRKIDGVVGLMERLRQDPKAYPRSPRSDHGAELATYVL